MKKSLVFLLILLLSITFSSCATVKENIVFSGDRSDIQLIEIYNLDKAYYEGDISKMRQENEPICIFDAQEHSDFIESISSLEFEKEKVIFPIPMDGGYDYSGYVIAMVYSNDSYDIIAEEGLYSFSVGNNGKTRHKYDHSDYCGEKSWADFIEEYIEN